MMTSYVIYVFKMVDSQGQVDLSLPTPPPPASGWSAELSSSSVTFDGQSSVGDFDDSVELIVNADETLVDGNFCDITIDFKIGGSTVDSIEITTKLSTDKKTILIVYNGVNAESLNLDINGNPYDGSATRLWDDVHNRLISDGSRYTDALGVVIAAADPNYAGVITSTYSEKTGLYHVATPYVDWIETENLPNYDIYDKNWVGGGTLETMFNSIKNSKLDLKTAMIGPRFYLPNMFYDDDVDIYIDPMTHPYYIEEPQPYLVGTGGIPMAGGLEKTGASDDWVFQSAQDVIRYEDPDFIFIMNTVPDIAGHFYGSEVDGTNGDQADDYGRTTQVGKTLDVMRNLDDQTSLLLQALVDRSSSEGKNAFDETIIALTGDHGMRTYYSGETTMGVDLRQYLFDNNIIRGYESSNYEYLEGLGGPGAYLFVDPSNQLGTINAVKTLLDPSSTLYRVYRLEEIDNSPNPPTWEIVQYKPIWKVLDKTDMQNGVSDMEPTTGQGFHLYDDSNQPAERVPDLVIALKPRFQQVAYADTAEGTARAQEEDTGISIPYYPENLDASVVGNHGDPLTQHVPMILHGPGIKQGYLSNSRVETIDVVPTLCRINGWYKPSGTQGRELDCIVQEDTF
jgi:hypothetical protein